MERFSPVFEALNAAGARYVVVGGVAVILHGYVRATTDIDLVIDLDPDSARRALAALANLGYRPKVPVRMEDFADPTQRESWIRDKGMVVFPLYSEQTRLNVDVFVHYPIDFDILWKQSEEAQLRRTTVRIPSLEHLLRIKRDAGRPRDLLDVAELEQIHRHDGRAGQGADTDRS